MQEQKQALRLSCLNLNELCLGSFRTLFYLRLLLCVVFVAATKLYAQNDALFQPAPLTNQYALSLLHLGSNAEGASVLGRDQYQVSSSFAVSNTSSYQSDYQIDVENRNYYWDVRYGIADQTELQLSAPIIWGGGGGLDNFLDNYHKALGLPRGDRNDVRDDQFLIAGTNKDGTKFRLESEGFSLGNVYAALKLGLMERSSSTTQLALELGLSLPTAQADFGHNGIDGLLKLVLSQPFKAFILHAGIAPIFYSDTEVDGLNFRRYHLEGNTTLQYIYNSNLSPYLGLYFLNRTISNIDDYPGYNVYLDIGLNIAIKESLVFQILLRENPTPDRESADVSLLMGLSWASLD